MNYLRFGCEELSVFDICQAHQQLESDYNVGGWLRERPSNLRRMESTSCQLSRLRYRDAHRWVDIAATPDSDDASDDESVRFIYLSNVMKWGLPADDATRDAIHRIFAGGWLEANHPQYLPRRPVPQILTD